MDLDSEAPDRFVDKVGGLCWGGLGLCKDCCLTCDADAGDGDAADNADIDADDDEPGGGGDKPMGYLLIPNEYLLEKAPLPTVGFGGKGSFFTGS